MEKDEEEITFEHLKKMLNNTLRGIENFNEKLYELKSVLIINKKEIEFLNKCKLKINDDILNLKSELTHRLGIEGLNKILTQNPKYMKNISEDLQEKSHHYSRALKALQKFDYYIIDSISEMEKNIQSAIGKENKILNSEKSGSVVNRIKIFISHSSKDEKIAEILIDFIKKAIEDLRVVDIRCTSVTGHKYEGGKNFLDNIKIDTFSCDYILSLFSKLALESSMFMFECGIGWYFDKVIPVIIDSDFEYDNLQKPFVNNVTFKLFSQPEILEFITDLSKKLKLELCHPTSLNKYCDEFLRKIKEIDNQKLTSITNNNPINKNDKMELYWQNEKKHFERSRTLR